MIETIGSAIDETILSQIRTCPRDSWRDRFTDPDFSGEKIRKIIMEAVPAAQHAFCLEAKLHQRKRGSLGVEHASDEALREALRKVVTPVSQQDEDE